MTAPFFGAPYQATLCADLPFRREPQPQPVAAPPVDRDTPWTTATCAYWRGKVRACAPAAKRASPTS